MINDNDREIIKKEIIEENEAKEVKYMVDGEQVTLSLSIITRYLCGDKVSITNKEAMMFLQLCKFRKINPFLREAFLIKYNDNPAQLVVSKEFLIKRASNNPNFDGMSAGVIVTNKGEIIEREGSLVCAGEILIGGWCIVRNKNTSLPSVSKVSIQEYQGHDKSQWGKMPATMIRKVAVAQSLREAFPEEFNGLYDHAEINSKNSLDTVDDKKEISDILIENKDTDLKQLEEK